MLIGIYVCYVKGHLDAEAEERRGRPRPAPVPQGGPVAATTYDPAVPRLRIVNVQVLFALGCIIGGAYLFVGAVDTSPRRSG